jgi:hypothetical protein
MTRPAASCSGTWPEGTGAPSRRGEERASRGRGGPRACPPLRHRRGACAGPLLHGAPRYSTLLHRQRKRGHVRWRRPPCGGWTGLEGGPGWPPPAGTARAYERSSPAAGRSRPASGARARRLGFPRSGTIRPRRVSHIVVAVAARTDVAGSTTAPASRPLFPACFAPTGPGGPRDRQQFPRYGLDERHSRQQGPHATGSTAVGAPRHHRGERTRWRRARGDGHTSGRIRAAVESVIEGQAGGRAPRLDRDAGPRATCSSRVTCRPASARRCWPRRWPASVDCHGPADPVHPLTCCPATSRSERLHQEHRDFEFKPGAVFANIVVGDEIKRASRRRSRRSWSAWRSGRSPSTA